MIENLKRIREPLAWVALALVVANMALNGWRLASALTDASLPEAAQHVGVDWLNTTVALLVVVLVLSCSLLTPATRHALLVARVTVVVLGVGVALTLLSVLFGMWASALGIGVVLDVLGGLLDVVVKALVAGTVWVFLRGVKAGRIETALAPDSTEAETMTASADAGADEPVSGSVWWTAADAAAGAPAHDRMPAADQSNEA